MAKTFPWQHGVFKFCCRGNAVLVLNYHRNFLTIISEIVVSIQKFISLESYFKIDPHGSKLLSVEVFDNILKLQSNITMKWPAGN